MRALVSVVLAGTVAFGATAAAGPVIAAPAWQTGNSAAAGDQDNVAMAANRRGDVAIVWEDDRDATNPGNNLHSDVWVRFFANGTSVYETKLSAGGTGNWTHLQPDVGLDDKGNAVVVWAADADGNGFYNIQVRVLSPSGALLHSATANTSSDGQQSQPAVGVDPDNVGSAPSTVSYTVVWEDQQGTAAPTVRAAAFKNATRAYEKQVHANGGTNRRPDVAVNASGEAVIVWDEDIDANGFFNIGLSKLSATGAVTLAKTLANVNGDGQQVSAAVAATFNGDFAVAWESGSRVVWRGFAPSGAARHGEVAASGPELTGAQSAPSIGLDDQGNVVLGWTQAGVDTYTHGYGKDGVDTARLAVQPLSRDTLGSQAGLQVAVSPWGEVTAAYTDDNDGNGFDQILLGFGIFNVNW